MNRSADLIPIIRRHLAAPPHQLPGRLRWLRLMLGLRRGLDQICQVLTSGWLISLAGSVCLSLLLWFLGPLFTLGGARPFDGEGPRLGGVLGIMVA
ncbi:MAG: hypothetical protein WCK65_13015, partial [Rhodospirillaceae bacterium]